MQWIRSQILVSGFDSARFAAGCAGPTDETVKTSDICWDRIDYNLCRLNAGGGASRQENDRQRTAAPSRRRDIRKAGRKTMLWTLQKLIDSAALFRRTFEFKRHRGKFAEPSHPAFKKRHRHIPIFDICASISDEPVRADHLRLAGP